MEPQAYGRLDRRLTTFLRYGGYGTEVHADIILSQPKFREYSIEQLLEVASTVRRAPLRGSAIGTLGPLRYSLEWPLGSEGVGTPIVGLAPECREPRHDSGWKRGSGDGDHDRKRRRRDGGDGAGSGASLHTF
jgi:hypothetical protein